MMMITLIMIMTVATAVGDGWLGRRDGPMGHGSHGLWPMWGRGVHGDKDYHQRSRQCPLAAGL
jgi:hypothetical protein